MSPHRSLLLMGFLTLIGTGVGVNIMAMAVLSPCPLLVNEASGGVIMVSITVVVCLFLNSASMLKIKNEENTDIGRGCDSPLPGPQVLCWILFVLTLSYVKVIIGVILRDEGHSALVWCGAVVQLGSLLGAVTMFPVVSVYSLFSSGDPCNTSC